MTEAAKGRVLMLGLDGLSAEFMEAPFVRDCMPNLTTLLENSTRGPLASTIPPYTAPAWTTITTGFGPGHHGVFGFTDRTGRPVSSNNVSLPRVWDYVGAAGGRSIVVNVPLTYPAQSIDGLIVAGMPAAPSGAWTYPEDLGSRLDEIAGGYVIDEPVIGNPRLEVAAPRLAEMTVKRGRVVKDLISSETWELFAVVFVLPDRLGHPWWKHLVPGTDLYSTLEAEKTRRALTSSLRALDRSIEDLMAATPSGTITVVCSDHGFGALEADIFFDVVLADAGLIEGGSGRVVRKVARRFAATRLGRAIPRRVIEAGKDRVASAGERAAWTAPKYDGAVRLSSNSDSALQETVVELLTGLRDPEGMPVVRKVLTREDLFQGDRVDEAAELYPELTREDTELHEGLTADRWWMSRSTEPWGTHRREGVFAIHGAHTSGAATTAEVCDITPTLLAGLGLQVEGLDGRSLLASPRTLTPIDASPRSRDGAEYDSAEEAAVMEHLRGLGYVE